MAVVVGIATGGGVQETQCRSYDLCGTVGACLWARVCVAGLCGRVVIRARLPVINLDWRACCGSLRLPGICLLPALPCCSFASHFLCAPPHRSRMHEPASVCTADGPSRVPTAALPLVCSSAMRLVTTSCRYKQAAEPAPALSSPILLQALVRGPQTLTPNLGMLVAGRGSKGRSRRQTRRCMVAAIT